MSEIEMEDTNLVPTGLETEDEDQRNTEEQDEAIRWCQEWYTIDREAKTIQLAKWDEVDKLRRNKHWDLLGPSGEPLRTEAQQALHPNSVENVVHSLIEGQVSEFAQNVDIIDFPVDAGDEEVAREMSGLKEYIAYKNRIPMERLKWLRNFFWYGTGIWKHVWDPTWKGGKGPDRWVGEVRWQSRNLRLVCPDARCGENIHHGRRIHDSRYVTIEYIREKFPEYGHLAQNGVFDTDLLSAEDETPADAQFGQTLLVETWYYGKPLIKEKGDNRAYPGLHVIWWCNEPNGTYLAHSNYQYLDEGEELQFPFTFQTLYPVENSPWGEGEPEFIKQMQIMLNKTADLIIEGHIHQVLGQTLYENESLSPKQQLYVEKTGTLAGNWLEVQNIEKIKRLYGSGIPASVQAEMNRLRAGMENITGRYDVTMGRTPGSVTAFKALALLDQRAQVRLRPADEAIKAGYEDSGRFINRIIPRGYTEQRAYRIYGTDENGQTEIKKRGVFKLENVQRAHFWATGQKVPLVMPDPETGRPLPTDLSQFMPQQADGSPAIPQEGPEDEGGDYELYMPEMDVRCRTSSMMPSERLFYMEMAKELLAAGVIDMEIFFSVVENGRFPPWATVEQKMMERMKAQAEAQNNAAPGQGSGSLPDGGRWTYTAQVKDPAQVAAINQGVGGQGQPQGQDQSGELSPEHQQLLDSLTPEQVERLRQWPPEKVEELVNMDPAELRVLMDGGGGGGQPPGPREWTSQGGMVDTRTGAQIR